MGLASYHFVSEVEGAYISYQHPDCTQWPLLDNGNSVPPKMFFRDIQWIPEDKIFHGTIDWEKDCQTTWSGVRRWIYELRFDSAMTCILSGNVISVTVEGDVQEAAIFGTTLIYINAAIAEYFLQLVTLSEERNDDLDWNDTKIIAGTARSFRRRLERDGAYVRTTTMMRRAFTLWRSHQGQSPIDNVSWMGTS